MIFIKKRVIVFKKHSIMKQKLLLEMLSTTIQELRANGQWGTAHVYRSARNSFSTFNNNKDIPFYKLDPNLLKSFEIYLRQRKCSWNTVSTYMKVLRAIYNRAVDNGYALYVPRLFKHVHTSVCADQRRALEVSDIGNLLCETEKASSCGSLPIELQTTKNIFALMFLLRGIPFVDLAYLRKADIQGNTLKYRRRKTGRLLTVMLTPDAIKLIRIVTDTRVNKHIVKLADANAQEYLSLDKTEFSSTTDIITISKKSSSTAIVTPPTCKVQLIVVDEWGKSLSSTDILVTVTK